LKRHKAENYTPQHTKKKKIVRHMSSIDPMVCNMALSPYFYGVQQLTPEIHVLYFITPLNATKERGNKII